MKPHSPGPWFWSARTLRREVKDDGGPSSAEDILAVDAHRCIYAINEADSNLIKAAPVLLKALKELVSRCDGEEGVRADGSNIQTHGAHMAISLAEGGGEDVW